MTHTLVANVFNAEGECVGMLETRVRWDRALIRAYVSHEPYAREAIYGSHRARGGGVS